MSKLSPTMSDGVIDTWLVKEGDKVKENQPLFTVATDKATMESSSPRDGTIHKIVIPAGGKAQVDQMVALLAEEDDNHDILQAAHAKWVAEDLEKFAVEPAPVAPNSPVPSTPDAPRPSAGGLAEPAFAPPPPLASYDFSAFDLPAGGRIAVSPLARKIAAAKGIDLAGVKGSGPGGRIMERDLAAGPDLGIAFGGREVPEDTLPGSYTEETLSRMRSVIAKRLQESKTFIPHFYISQDVNVEPLVALREQLNNLGLKVSFNDFVVKATALALRENPAMNSGFNSVNGTIVHYETVDISIAVSLPEGLITPIVRLADYKNLGQISTEVKSLASRARAGKLQPEEYVGGSFTISNLGMYGVSGFVGIINPPQGGILSVGGIEDKPVIKNGAVVAGKQMTLTLSADHRVIDGADGAKFIKSIQKFLENPAALLL